MYNGDVNAPDICRSSGARLLGGGLTLCRIPTIVFLASSIYPGLSLVCEDCLLLQSQSVGKGLFLVLVQNSVLWTDVSVGESCLEERLVTHLSVVWWVGLVPVRHCKNFCLSLVLIICVNWDKDLSFSCCKASVCSGRRANSSCLF